MTTAEVAYTGSLMTRAVHTRSGTAIVTDAPVDNQGKGSAFSPTDLVAAALLTCKITTMAIACQARGWAEPAMSGTVIKHMADSPRRIARLEVQLRIEGFTGNDDERRTLEAIGRGCPVARSLGEGVVVEATFTFA